MWSRKQNSNTRKTKSILLNVWLIYSGILPTLVIKLIRKIHYFWMTTGPERRRKMSEISGKTSIEPYCMLPVHQEHHNNNLLTSLVRAVWKNIKPRSCCIDLAIAKSIQQDRGLIFSHTARTNKVSKFFIIWHTIYC